LTQRENSYGIIIWELPVAHLLTVQGKLFTTISDLPQVFMLRNFMDVLFRKIRINSSNNLIQLVSTQFQGKYVQDM
jgi:Na+/alanine symporter